MSGGDGLGVAVAPRRPAFDAWRTVPVNLDQACATVEGWRDVGEALGEVERCVMWQIGEWWNKGERYGERVAIVRAPDWTGPTHGTCREAARVAARFSPSARFDVLGFKHHAVVAALPDDQARALLAWAAEPEQPRSTRELAARVKQVRRDDRERDLGAATVAAGTQIGQRLYSVIYADPPWRFEPYSRESGMDRAADNHYPTMDLDAIKALAVPAADDCVLFLWATAPMLPQAIEVMDAWGFSYRSHCVWVKDKAGTGYWFRSCHELLLVGTRGAIPAPAPGTQYPSVVDARAEAHSAKPAIFREMIDEAYPSQPALEMFARQRWAGWDVWGNQVVEATS